jgi:hypothetical protein
MAGRAFGAILALVAVIAFAGALASSVPGPAGRLVPAWWDGHPRVAGKEIDRKDIHLALALAEGCNLGETVECQPIEIGRDVKLAALGELALVGFALIVALVLASSTWRVSGGRKPLATIARIAVVLAGAGAGALALLGPDVRASQPVGVPWGAGFLLCGVGMIATAIASVIAPRLSREPIRLKTAPVTPLSTNARPAPARHVREILQEQHDLLRPSSLGPEPMLGANPGQPGPAPASGPQAPLLAAAPRLRPLYDLQGAPPVPASPSMPTRPPTPMSPDAVRAFAGIPSPPTSTAPASAAQPAPAAADEQRQAGRDVGDADERAAPERPALRVPTIAEARRAASEMPTMPARAKAASAVPPPSAAGSAFRPVRPHGPLLSILPRSETVAPEPLTNRPIARAARDAADTEESPVVSPPPDADVAPPVRESITAVEIDAEAKAAAQAAKAAAQRPVESASTSGKRAAAESDIENARAPTVRVSEARGEDAVASPSEAPIVPLSTAPRSLPPPKVMLEETGGPSPACPQCEAPMAWVDEHLRFYCKQCRMYF